MQNRKRVWWGCGILLLVLMCGLVVVVAGGWIGLTQYEEVPRLVSDFSYGGQLENPYVLSEMQQGWVDENGYPASFSILFYEEEAPGGGNRDVRHETWYYFEPDLQVTFINGGDANFHVEASDLTGGQVRWNYQPEMFTAFMSQEDIARVTGIDEWMIVPVEEELVPGADVYFADGLTFGMKYDRLIYVEAFAGE